MKKYIIALCLATSLAVLPTAPSHAAIWIVIQEALKKAIKAIDLAIQQQQNKVLVLQNAQKKVENVMSKLKLDEISDWVEKQRTLYKDYFDELQRVRDLISYYNKVKQITSRQQLLVADYRHAFSIFQRDGHFTPAEIIYMGQVYNGMLTASLKVLDQLPLAIQSLTSSMTDGQRLTIIDECYNQLYEIENDLKQFNNQNILLSVQRNHDEFRQNSLKALLLIK